MCQKAPGPRCTPHVRARLDSALRRLAAARAVFEANPALTRSRERLAVAARNVDERRAEFDATPGGQDELRTQLRTEDDADTRAELQRRLDAGAALRRQQTRAAAQPDPDEPKDTSNDHQPANAADPAGTRNVLASPGMDPGAERSGTLDDRTAVDRSGDRGSTRTRLLIGNRHLTPTRVHQLDPARAQQLRRRGHSTPDLHELSPSDADLYRQQMQKLAATNRFAASVHIYSTDEYADMRLFVTDDGRSGIAMNGNEIVSVYSHRDSNYPGSAPAMLAVAVEQGGRRLDCFDTALPSLYAEAGFIPVARMKWNDDYAPDGWDYQLYQRYNAGRPDVVFMAYDPRALDSRYEPGTGHYVDTYDDGTAAVHARLAD
jgi:hypothetical protein